MRPIQLVRQITLEVKMEEISTKKQAVAKALVDSGCTWTCVDEAFAREQNWPLKQIKHPIPIKYADGTITEASKIWYSVNLRIKVAGAMVLTGALVTQLKMFKVFLGFDWLQAVNPDVDWQQMKVSVPEGQVPLEMQQAQECPPVLSHVKYTQKCSQKLCSMTYP
jgi:predicted aspartyl protease